MVETYLAGERYKPVHSVEKPFQRGGGGGGGGGRE